MNRVARVTALILILVLIRQSLTGLGLTIVSAYYDPRSVPNNKVGIHILDPVEIEYAAAVVNQNADWGYVTVPIRVDDLDVSKWEKFFKGAQEYRVIPILRLATSAVYPGSSMVWRVPTQDDIDKFASFLDQFDWPILNRYIIVFNEPNHASEWGGIVDPKSYGEILSYAVKKFKSQNQDFFVISAGLDQATTTNGASKEAFEYLNELVSQTPDIFEQIDGWASHSYPNPNFSGSPRDRSKMSISGYTHEREFLAKKQAKNLPIFITETGWSRQDLTLTQIARFLEESFATAWLDPDIVAVTPFVLAAYDGPFSKFSFLEEGKSSLLSQTLSQAATVSGEPKIPSPTPTPTTFEAEEVQEEQQTDSKTRAILASLRIFLTNIFKVLENVI